MRNVMGIEQNYSREFRIIVLEYYKLSDASNYFSTMNQVLFPKLLLKTVFKVRFNYFYVYRASFSE